MNFKRFLLAIFTISELQIVWSSLLHSIEERKKKGSYNLLKIEEYYYCFLMYVLTNIFDCDSLHPRLNSHYEAELQEKESQKG